MERDSLTQEKLMALLNYNPATGTFRWGEGHARKYSGMLAGTLCPNGYVKIGVAGHRYLAHRLAWLYIHGSFPSGVIDHRNCIRDDNRISNLRDVSQSVNLHNRKEKPAGISETRWGSFDVSLKVAGKPTYRKVFKTREAAELAYATAREELCPTH